MSRSAEEIKADIKRWKSECDIHYSITNLGILQRYEDELRAALTADIPLDELEALCNAWRDGRVVVQFGEGHRSAERSKAACHDCGMPYGGPDWTDTVLPNDQWALIYSEREGLLCANCIIKRASALDGIIRADMHLVFADDIKDEEARP